jgi:hypothetical protein
MKIALLLLLSVVSYAEDSLVMPGVTRVVQLPFNTTAGFATTRFSLSIEIDFKDDLLSNIIWFSAIEGKKTIIGLSDTGYVVNIDSTALIGDVPTISQPSVLPLLDSDGTPLTVEMYAASGSVVSGDLTLESGIYAGFTIGNVREFAQVTSPTSGVVAKSTNPIGLCDAWLSEEILTGCPNNEPATIMSSSKPDDDTETIGSILFSCQSPSAELLIPGWVCNPSTGDSTRFSIKANDKYTSLTAMGPCATCDPSQMFLLFTHFDSDGSRKSVSIESTQISSITEEEDDDSDRVVLFSLATTDIVFLSLSVIPGTQSEILLYLFGYNVSSPTTAYVVYTYTIDMNASASSGSVSSKNDYTLSVFILFILVCLGVAIPLLIRFNPHVRARIENVRWMKHAEQIGLVGDSGDESDPESRKLAIPRKFGHQSPHTPRQLKPINESNISGS